MTTKARAAAKRKKTSATSASSKNTETNSRVDPQTSRARTDKKASSRQPPHPYLVVGVGASAGGMEAFIGMLRNLPSEINAAFIFICHLDPHHRSSLDEIFQRQTRLPVASVTEPIALKPGNIYVLPPNKQLRLSGGVLMPEPRRSASADHRPIDFFFRSLAADQGNAAVGVLLSGNGNDGVTGIQEIKAEGGITFCQNEVTAAFPILPRNALASGCVDFVLPPEGIAAEIQRLIRHPAYLRPRKADSDNEPLTDLQRVFSLLRALNGVDFSYYKHSTLKRRITRRMVLRKIHSLRDYVGYLHQNPAEVDLLFNDLLINVTSFFRDPHVFSALRRKVFPKLLKKSRGEPVRIWVPGCSTGEEVYSLAIALFELFGKKSQSRPIQVFATDISETALSKARAGVYPESISTHVSSERLRRYFQRLDNGNYQIAKFIRDSCVFARQNLIEDPPFSKLDLISCRNVLIYLGPLLQKKVIPIFHYALKPGGHLLLGGSETIGLFADLFTLVDKTHKIYSKVEVASRPEVGFQPRAVISDPVDSQPTPISPQDTRGGAFDLNRHVDRLLLAQFAPSGVVVNSKMEVLQFRGQTAPYIEHAPGDASLNLMRLLRQELLVDVRTALSRAAKADILIRKNGIEFSFLGKKRFVNLEVTPFKLAPSTERFFLVVFNESFGDALPDKPLTASKPATPEARREISQLREELRTSKETLQAIIEEQEATNEELKSANEEIQSSNEELQSTNEELETAKEELQSTNEELTTLNEELHTRNVELSQLNNDLRNLLSSVSMPILMLGNDLTVRRFTPLAERFFNLIPSDIGRRISDINPNVIIPNLGGLVSEVIETLKTQEHDVQDREGRWYSLRIRPYRTTDNKIDGAVILLVDVDEIKRGLTEFMSMVNQPLLTLRGDLRVLQANEAFYDVFKTTPRDVENKAVYDLHDGAWALQPLRNLLEAVLPEKNRVENFQLQVDIPAAGRKFLRINARRLFQRSKGTQITLLAFTETGPTKLI